MKTTGILQQKVFCVLPVVSSALGGLFSSLGECHLLASLAHSLFACASLFIANRALNLTLEMDIALVQVHVREKLSIMLVMKT